jgi:hypothetical protein
VDFLQTVESGALPMEKTQGMSYIASSFTAPNGKRISLSKNGLQRLVSAGLTLMVASAPALPKADDVAPGPAGPGGELVRAVASYKHLTRPGAVELLTRQRRLEAAADRIDRDLGREATGGSWIEEDARRLAVHVTSTRQAEVVREDGGEPRPATRTMADLERLQAQVDGIAHGLPGLDASWHIDRPANTVDVEVSGTPATPTALAFRAGVQALGPGMRFREGHGRPRDRSLVLGGNRIREAQAATDRSPVGQATGLCSAGLWAERRTPGTVPTSYLITAGHCASDPGLSFLQVGDSRVLGQVDRYETQPDDWAVIAFDPTSDSASSVLINSYGGYTYGGTNHGASSPYAVVGSHVPTPGATVCKSGAFSGLTCGSVENVDSETTTTGGRILRHQIEVLGACVKSGDSGGPLFEPQADGSAVAVGITGQADWVNDELEQIYGSEDVCPTEVGHAAEEMESFSTPVATVLAATGLTLFLAGPRTGASTAGLGSAPRPVAGRAGQLLQA